MEVNWIDVANQIFAASITAGVTILGGVLVLVIGQLVVRLFVEPIHEQAKLRGEIYVSLTLYKNVYGGAKLHGEERVHEASHTLRNQASQLRASLWIIRWYRLWQCLSLVPRRENVIKASTYLIFLSNSMYTPDYAVIEERHRNIEALLNLET